MKVLLVIGALLLPATASTKAPECYDRVGQRYDDGTTNKGEGGMYDIPLLRKLIYALIQELNETERGKALASEKVIRLIGPCLQDGMLFTYEP